MNGLGYYFVSDVPADVQVWLSQLQPGDVAYHVDGSQVINHGFLPVHGTGVFKVADSITGSLRFVRPDKLRPPHGVCLAQMLGLATVLDPSTHQRLIGIGNALGECFDDASSAAFSLPSSLGSVLQGWSWTVGSSPRQSSPWGVWVFMVPDLQLGSTTPPSAAKVLEALTAAFTPCTWKPLNEFVQSLKPSQSVVINDGKALAMDFLPDAEKCIASSPRPSRSAQSFQSPLRNPSSQPGCSPGGGRHADDLTPISKCMLQYVSTAGTVIGYGRQGGANVAHVSRQQVRALPWGTCDRDTIYAMARPVQHLTPAKRPAPAAGAVMYSGR